MKKIVVTFFILLTMINCTDSDYDNNPYLAEVAVSHTVYLNNPSNNNILFTGGYVEISGGIKGIVIYHSSGDLYYAYDLACPNAPIDDCSKMTVDGLNMICSCDDSKYALALGGTPQTGEQYGAKEYKVVNNGSTLYISNY